MNAIVNTGPGALELHDRPLPQPRAGQVRVRTGACGICATDLEMIAGSERTGFPSILGHEWAGVVDAAGEGVDAGWIGARCVGENVLADGGEIGFEHPGGYAEFFLTEARNLHRLPEDFSPATATLIEPLAVSVRGIRRLDVRDTRAALVLGDGPIGLMTAMLLRHAGVEEVSLVGGRPKRLALAQELGVGKTLNYHGIDGELAAAVREKVGCDFPNVIEATGNGTPATAAMELVASEGKILVLGDYGAERAGFAWNRVLHREISLIGSNASAGAWEEAVRLATADALPLERFVSHRFPVARYEEAVATARNSRDVVKVVLEWE